MDFSVIVVNWNGGDLFLQALQSMIHATERRHMEIIVIDNASTDGSLERVQQDFRGVQLIRNGSNLGFSKANNIGIRRSKGRYICLINPDVIVPPGILDRMSAYMDEHPSVGILGPKISNADLSLQFSCREFPSLWNNFCRAMALDTMFPQLVADPLMQS
jgi:GT2 family glycosyltransferase